MHMICKKVKFMKPLTFVTISISTCVFFAMPICQHLSHSFNLHLFPCKIPQQKFHNELSCLGFYLNFLSAWSNKKTSKGKNNKFQIFKLKICKLDPLECGDYVQEISLTKLRGWSIHYVHLNKKRSNALLILTKG